MKSLEAAFGPNTALVEELYNQYKDDPESVPNHWKNYFDKLEGKTVKDEPESEQKSPSAETPLDNGAPNAQVKSRVRRPTPQPVQPDQLETDVEIPEDAELEKIKGIPSKIAENMEQSLKVPTATSVRDMAVKMLIEDRDIVNRDLTHRVQSKTSFTHYIAWAIIKALEEYPNLNHFFARKDGQFYRVKPSQVNLGIAIDIEDKNGERQLVVPNIKKVDQLSFKEFIEAFNDLVYRARNGELQLEDYQRTTISITNPGMIGTVQSVPRLMTGQGAILATGSIDYPAEYQSMSQEVLSQLGISKVMTMTCTYDHRIIQGAESGAFLKRVQELLNDEAFYQEIFDELDISHKPIPYDVDKYAGQLDGHGASLEQNKKAIAVMQLINMYRTRGHVQADLNPLRDETRHSPELDFEYYGLTMWDLDREFYCGGLGGYEKAPLRTIIKLLRDTYCGYIGAEYMHLLDLEERKWLREQMESTTNDPDLDQDEKRRILHKLNQAGAFEKFLHRKYIGHKRFSLEGADTLIPMLDFLLEKAGEHEVEKIFLGMAHRGRLNVHVNTLNKPYHKVFAEFEGNIDPDTIQGSGDVKYHLGARGKHEAKNGNEIEVELMPNPSHLESVNPVVEGATRSIQDQRSSNGIAFEESEKQFVPLLLHGDAAFSGQGVVAETLNMSQLDGFKTGGTIHVIINNQIGFTTLPSDGRSTEYASDLAKMILAPIFHVNGDEPESAVHAIRMAMDYRQKFGKDVVIDLVCYRRHGHNEGDEPGFTQPGMYKEIDNHESVRDIYTKELVHKGDLSEEETNQIIEEFDELLQDAFEDAKNAPSLEVTDDMMDRSETPQKEWTDPPDTSYPLDDLKAIGTKINTVPKDFDANPKLLRNLAKRAEIVEQNQKKIDWGLAEALAFGSLLKNGTPVRLTGQDAERGTFSHRHAVLHGTDTQQKFAPLNNLSDDQATFHVYNSLLSEFAVVGFEFGYSTANLDALVVWEAQFGDFVNGAQIPIDQYIAACEAKWGQKTNLVMNLPHGYEGQGPEHSSGRLERFLQLCAEDNLQVMNLTTPAQYFHVLRKQVMQDYKKPLIIMSPKSLLRHPMAVSSTEELADGSFHPLLPETELENPESVDRLIFCSGKVYYDLLRYRQENEIDNVALLRLEQFYPFPDLDIQQTLQQYSDVDDIVWCQEEPKNQGAWQFIFMRMQPLLAEGQKLTYIGRQAAAAPATGQKKIHEAEQQKLIENTFTTS